MSDDEAVPMAHPFESSPAVDKLVPFANLMVSVLQLYGVETESYGKDMCASNGSVSLA